MLPRLISFNDYNYYDILKDRYMYVTLFVTSIV